MWHLSICYFCRYRELEEKLDYLQKSSAQRDRTEALLKQKEKDFSQVWTKKIQNRPAKEITDEGAVGEKIIKSRQS